MIKKLALSDFKRNSLVYLAIALFVSLTAFLLTQVFLLQVSLFGSIDQLMDKAKTPDFLQMHQGAVDMDKLITFAEDNPDVADFQCLEFVNIEGNLITVNGKNQDFAVQDNGIVYQSDRFDFLLDLNNQVIEVEPGEIYLPLMFYKDQGVEKGQRVQIADMEFLIKGFFRDSQMNSNMAGSKRLLLNQADFDQLKQEGLAEYLIEFRLKDRQRMTEFETAYAEQIPYKNGPTITYAMFKMINGLNDGIMIAVLLIASFLVTFIALLCIRFTLLAKLEEDFLEIAGMKAIGMKHSYIKWTYLGRYALLIGLACALGYLMGLVLKDWLLESLILYMGKGDLGIWLPVLAFAGPLLLFIFINIYINHKLQVIRSIKPIAAIRDGESGLSKKAKVPAQIKSVNFTYPLVTLAFLDIKDKRPLYGTMIKLLVLATFLTLIPMHLYTTLADPSFMTHLGMGQADLSIQVQADSGEKNQVGELVNQLKDQPQVDKIESYANHTIQVLTPADKQAYLKVSLGQHQTFPIDYHQGRGPQAKNEIALSKLYLDDLEVKLGDQLRIADTDQKLTIVGVYSDISNGGKTAKANFDWDGQLSSTSIQVKSKHAADLEKISQIISKNYPRAKVFSVDQYMNQAFGSLKDQLYKAFQVALVLSLIVISLISGLFAKLLISKDYKKLANLKAVGFSSHDLRIKYLLSISFITGLALIIGILLANSLGSMIASGLISSFGVTSLAIRVHPTWTYLYVPLAFLLVVTGTSYWVGQEIKRLRIAQGIKE